MKTIPVIALVFLAGCAPLMTAEEMRLEPAHNYTLSNPVGPAAECVRDRAESISTLYNAEIRGSEVRIRFGEALNGLVMFEPIDKGSIALVRVPPGFMRDPAMYVRGC